MEIQTMEEDEVGFLLKCTDEAVGILQSAVTELGKYYEAHMKVKSLHSLHTELRAPNMDAVALTFDILSELLAKLWPCEHKYVAVIGPTGCGKSTLLNALIAMTSRTGTSYIKGIEQKAVRAALQETARHHGRNANGPEEDMDVELPIAPDSESTPLLTNGPGNSKSNVNAVLDIAGERRSMCGLLGMCCARKRAAYLSEHLPSCDKNPFLLLNGRMGDAGTTKVAAVQWGPKFVCRIRWIEKKKLKKRWKELRKFKDNPASAETEESQVLECKELWERALNIVGHQFPKGQLPVPTEELIDATLGKLAKEVQLGKTETIETMSTRGCVLDRLHVRDGIRNSLHEHKLGLLCEELIIEAPIPSFEGGVSLLDVPGTNDPRHLHQRETRDAIDRTELILLVLDRAVVDEDTMAVLQDSPILERMLLDTSSNCCFVVVGIAEKCTNSTQSPIEAIQTFDPKGDLLKAIRKCFSKKARSLMNSQRLDRTEAVQRVKSIFEGGRFSVLPVMPLLCASLHISGSNHKLHQEFCESPGMPTCPLSMTDDERMARCMETNVPQLLERIHSVRMPPKKDYLRSQLDSALELLKSITQKSTYDSSVVDFLRRELKHAKSVTSTVALEELLPDEPVDLTWIHEVLRHSAEECAMSQEDVNRLTPKLDSKVAIKAALNAELFQLAPQIMHGFRPEQIGRIAQKLVKPIEEKATAFVNCVIQRMEGCLNGDLWFRESTMEKVSLDCLASCVALLEGVQKRWKLNLDRVLARCLCGGKTGGLLEDVRCSLRDAYDMSMKHLLKELRKQRNEVSQREEVVKHLTQNKAGKQVQNLAAINIEDHLKEFWTSVLDIFGEEIEKMWKGWRKQLDVLIHNTKLALEKQKVVNDDTVNPCEQGDFGLPKFLEGAITKLESLKTCLMVSDEAVNYGYNLLQSNPSFEVDLDVGKKRLRPEKLELNPSTAVEPVNYGYNVLQSNPSFEVDLDVGKKLLRPEKLELNPSTAVEPDQESSGSQQTGGETNPAGQEDNSSKKPTTPLRRMKTPRKLIALSDTESHNLQLRESSQQNSFKRKRP